MKKSFQRIRLVCMYVHLAAASMKLLQNVIELVNLAFNYLIKDVSSCHAVGYISLK